MAEYLSLREGENYLRNHLKWELLPPLFPGSLSAAFLPAAGSRGLMRKERGVCVRKYMSDTRINIVKIPFG